MADIVINLYDVSELTTDDVVKNVCETIAQSDLLKVSNNPFEMYSAIKFEGFIVDLDWVKEKLDEFLNECSIGSYDVIGLENGKQVYYVEGSIF